LSGTEQAELKVMPASLAEALDALETDNGFLLKGDVMTEDAVRTWIDYKRENEIAPVALRPHPHEFELYFDL
jgi:glutamine synthetase